VHLRSGALEPAAWPVADVAHLMETLEAWLGPWVDGMTRRTHLARVDLPAALLARLDGAQQRALEELAPTHLTVPSGSRLPIDYADPSAPALHVRLQEVFGLTTTPHLGGGRVPLVLHLLSPAHRPVQVTRDLESFWSRGYTEVKKELKGRYPKHYWPEDPRVAVATARASRWTKK
jgi:ATP-dependent helicase HrpB